MYRKRVIIKNWQKVAEALFFAFLTAVFFFGGVMLTKDRCKKVDA